MIVKKEESKERREYRKNCKYFYGWSGCVKWDVVCNGEGKPACSRMIRYDKLHKEED